MMGNCFGTQVAEGRFDSGVTTTSGLRTSTSSPVVTNGSWNTSNSNSGDISAHSGSVIGAGLRAFSYADLKASTRNFRPDSLLGEGGFGCVFKGYIDEQTFIPTRPGQGIVVAVKKLNPDGMQGHQEWLAEVHFLGTIHHPNLVKLIGFCAEDEHRLLVYEFMSRGSLENHLFRKGNLNQSLSWAIRMKVAVGAARGLAFLHSSPTQVIYRDFKASNILLDSQYNAKLSDFGLAKNGPTGDNTHVSTRVMGTYGYAAPEYVATGHLTARSDVYSFGVVLLEILTGRRAVDKNRPCGEQNLVEWAKPHLSDKRKVLRVVDQKLEGQYSLKGVLKAANVAYNCLSSDAKNRPTMKEVVESLEPLLDARDLSKPSNNQNGKARPQERNGVGNVKSNMNVVSSPGHGTMRQANGVSPYQSPRREGFGERRHQR